MEYNGKVIIGLESPVGFSLVGNKVPLGEASSPSQLHSIGFDIQSKWGLLLEYREEEDGFYSREVLVL